MRYLYILLALVYITQSHAQTSNIVGQVINKDSVAIEGVAIILQKQDSTFIAGTITDKEGRFTLPMTEAQVVFAGAKADAPISFGVRWKPETEGDRNQKGC